MVRSPDFEIDDQSVSILCPGCRCIIVVVPKGKTKISLQSEAAALKDRLRKIEGAGVLERIFLWRSLTRGVGR